MVGEEGVPTMILGDFNCEPATSKAVRQLIAEESWIDVGHCADWWGGTPDEKTCHQRAKAKETSIDGILANMWLVPHVGK